MITTRLRTVLLGSGAAIALVAASSPGMANEMDEMRAQIQALQAKINTIEAKQSTTHARRVMPAAGTPVVSGVHKGYIIPGTKTSMRIGGYVKMDLVYDINGGPGTGTPIGGAGTMFGGAPSLAFKAQPQMPVSFISPRSNTQGRFKLQSRQTRFNIRTWTPTDWGELATHIEVDFFGATGGDGEVFGNSFGPRLRHAYGRLGPVLAGQTWTTFMDLWAIPETIDFFAVASESFIRQSMVRYTHNFGGGTTLQLAVENPHTVVTVGGSKLVPGTPSPLGVGAGPFGAGGGTNLGPLVSGNGDVDHVPDFIAALTHVWKGGGRTPNRIKFSAVFRQLTIDNGSPGGAAPAGPAFADSAFGWGLHVGIRYWVTRNDQLQLAVNGGEGIGRYILAGFSPVAR